ncbi:MAG: hypothetical protein EOM59_00245 [Clostridia bacterium]|nr:hypothetical protein [Clostridia bacterium]
MELTRLLDLINDAFTRSKYYSDYFKYEELDKQKKQLINGITKKALKNDGNDGVINIDMTLEDIKSDIASFQRNIEDFISGLTKDKYIYALRFDLLIRYLNEEYLLSISNEFLKKFKFNGVDQRRIAILKYLHEDGDGKSRKDIAEAFGIDEKTLREDMNVLIDGFHFMDNTLHINGQDKTGKIYSSPVHPIFLALNTTQIWSCIIGLKILSKGSVLEPDLSEIADMIYAQLSPFAKKIIEDKCKDLSIPLGSHDLEFKDSLQYLKMDLYKRLSHLLRKSALCRIQYYDKNETINEVIGSPFVYIDSDNKLDRILVQASDGRKVIIYKENLIDIEYMKKSL